MMGYVMSEGIGMGDDERGQGFLMVVPQQLW
jgi:hypothetical protein